MRFVLSSLFHQRFNGDAQLTGVEGIVLQANRLDRRSSMKVNLLLVAVSVLCSATIFGQSNSPSLAFVIPEGMRAIAIGGGAVTGAVTSVKAGDRVDILATYRDPRSKQEVTKMIMQNVLVLAVTKGKADPSRKEAGKSSMTLAVRPEQAELVAAADGAGALSVWLPPAHDEKAAAPSRPGVGDFWLPGEFQRLLEERKQQRRQESE
jgi:Flp pilus assembly protein CpaB